MCLSLNQGTLDPVKQAPHRTNDRARAWSSSLSSPSASPKTSPYRGMPLSSTGGLPHCPGAYPNSVPGGIGALSPGICVP